MLRRVVCFRSHHRVLVWPEAGGDGVSDSQNTPSPPASG